MGQVTRGCEDCCRELSDLCANGNGRENEVPSDLAMLRSSVPRTSGMPKRLPIQSRIDFKRNATTFIDLMDVDEFMINDADTKSILLEDRLN